KAEAAPVDGVAHLISADGPFWLDRPPVAEGSPLAEVDRALGALEAMAFPQLDFAIGIQEGGVPDTAYAGIQDVRLQRRGDYGNLGDVVPRRMPLLFKGREQAPVRAGSGRLELAEWVASAE